MPGTPQHSPLTGFPRAVQAYSYSRIQGNSIESAERAALAAYPALRNHGGTEYTIADVARASAGARQAAGALGVFDPGNPAPLTPNQGRTYGLGAGKSAPGGATYRTITASVLFQPGGAQGLSMGTQPRYKAVQVDAPVGMPLEAIREELIAAALALIEGPESDYPGTVLEIDVQTVIGQ